MRGASLKAPGCQLFPAKGGARTRGLERPPAVRLEYDLRLGDDAALIGERAGGVAE